MEQSHWKANNRFDNQEIARLLCNQKLYYRGQSKPPLEPVLTQKNIVYILQFNFLDTHFNIINRLCLNTPIGLFPSGF